MSSLKIKPFLTLDHETNLQVFCTLYKERQKEKEKMEGE
jgi:hypothetical protein